MYSIMEIKNVLRKYAGKKMEVYKNRGNLLYNAIDMDAKMLLEMIQVEKDRKNVKKKAILGSYIPIV